MLGDPNSFRRTEPAVQLFITLTHYVCRRGSRINTERFLTSRKVWGHTPSGIVFLDFNSPKVPFPGFLSHSDSIFTDCPNHFPDFNLESLKFSFSIPKKKKWKIWQIFIKRWKPVWIRAWFGWSHEKYDVRPRPNIHNNYHLRTSDWWEKKKGKVTWLSLGEKLKKAGSYFWKIHGFYMTGSSDPTWFSTTKWPPLYCFGTLIWLPWRHMQMLDESTLCYPASLTHILHRNFSYKK